jgi:hypothetical protein
MIAPSSDDDATRTTVREALAHPRRETLRRRAEGDANKEIGFTGLNVCSRFPPCAWIFEEMENRQWKRRQDERQ